MVHLVHLHQAPYPIAGRFFWCTKFYSEMLTIPRKMFTGVNAVACILLFQIAAASQPVFSSLSDADFKPPETTFDTTIFVTTLPSLIRFTQVSRIWRHRTEVDFEVYFQPKPCGELQYINKGMCRSITLSLPISYEGIYYVHLKGRDGKNAKARIELKSSNHLVTATAKFWQL